MSSSLPSPCCYSFQSALTVVYTYLFLSFFHALLIDTGRQVLDTFLGVLTDIDRCARSRMADVNPPLRFIAGLGLA